MIAYGGLISERWARLLCSLASNLDYKLPHKFENPPGERPRVTWRGSSQSLQAPGTGWHVYLLNKQMRGSAGYPALFLILNIFQTFQVHRSHLRPPSATAQRTAKKSPLGGCMPFPKLSRNGVHFPLTGFLPQGCFNIQFQAFVQVPSCSHVTLLTLCPGTEAHPPQ